MRNFSARVTRGRGRVAAALLSAALLVTAPLATASAGTAVADRGAGGEPPGIGADRHGPVEAFEQHRWFTSDRGVPHPLAVTVLDGSGLLAVAHRTRRGTGVTLLDPAGDRVAGRMHVVGLGRPTTLADDGHGHLAALSGRRLLTWPASARGDVRPHVSPVEGAALGRPAGMSWDPQQGTWVVLDSAADRLVRVTPGISAHATPSTDLSALPADGLTGVAVDPTSGSTFVAAAGQHLLFEVDGGAPARTFRVADVPELDTLAFGPSADPTDSQRSVSLFATASGDASTPGRVSEVSLAPVGAAAEATLAATSSTATLVRRTPLSELDPPSPDPAGIVYQSDVDRLFVVDSEVDEMPIYRGVNMWQLTRSGAAVTATGTSLGFSREPTGVGYDPAGKRLFISDDDKARVFQLTTGPDSRFGTADDGVSSFLTNVFGNDDLEDVTYDTRDKALYVTQGVGQEVWRVGAGPDGRFDGIAPTGDDVVTHFDAAVYGLIDLEGIGYSPTRDTLFLMDRKYTQIVEVTTDGALVQSIDVAGIGMSNPAAITLGPASTDATRTSMYVVVRAVDNNTRPDENDGTMYELSSPGLGGPPPPANEAPSVAAGSDQAVQLPASASLRATVTDDGLPDPPGALTVAWAKVSGPGTVAFSSPSAAATTASFSAAGTYVLQVNASDGALTRSDQVTVTVEQADAPPVVNAGPDLVGTTTGPAALAGRVVDPGHPAPVTTSWTRVSGPGTVDFADPSSPGTSATFSAPGTYVLRLTGRNAAGLVDSDDVSVRVEAADLTLRLSVSARALVAGATEILSGRVTRTADASPVPGIPVRVTVRRAPRNAARVLGTVTTGADGRYRITDRPTVGTLYVATTATDATTPLAVAVRPRLTARFTDASVRRRALTRVVGVVAPSASGQPVLLQQARAGRWVTVARTRRVASRVVGYGFSVRVRRAGRYGYRVVAPAYAGRSQAVTPLLRLVVRR